MNNPIIIIIGDYYHTKKYSSIINNPLDRAFSTIDHQNVFFLSPPYNNIHPLARIFPFYCIIPFPCVEPRILCSMLLKRFVSVPSYPARYNVPAYTQLLQRETAALCGQNGSNRYSVSIKHTEVDIII